MLFAGREPVAALARGGLPVADDAGWEELALGGVTASVLEPLGRWTVALDGPEHGFALTFTALGPPAELPADSAAAGSAGWRATSSRARSRARCAPAAASTRSAASASAATRGASRTGRASRPCARSPPGRARTSPSRSPPCARPARGTHADEPAWAALLGRGGALTIADPRLSTTYDADGHQRRAGLELWVGEDDELPAPRLGRVLCGSTLELGQLELDCAFFRWHLDGRTGVGRYDILPAERV